MNFFTFRFSAYSFQLMLYLCLGSLTADMVPGTVATQTTTNILKSGTDSQRKTNVIIQSTTQPSSTLGPGKSTASLSNAATVPKDVAKFTAVNQNESSITLQWTTISGISVYILEFEGLKTNITKEDAGTHVTYVVGNLSSGTEYHFTLYSVLNGIRSTGAKLTTSTTPGNVENVTVVGQTETTVIIQFDKVNGSDGYNLSYSINGVSESEDISLGNDSKIEHTVDGLMPAKTYGMTLYSKLGSDQSTGYFFNATTAPKNVADFIAVNHSESSLTLQWKKISDIPLYILKFEGSETNITEKDAVAYVVGNLSSATEYNFTLYSVFEDIRSTGVNLTTNTAPSKAKGFKVASQNETRITLQWNNENQKIDYILMDNEGKNLTIDGGNTSLIQYPVMNLLDTTTYNFTLFTVFGNISGDGVSISAATQPRNPTNFTAENQTNSTITLQWNKVNDVQHYEVEYKTIEETDKQTKSVNTSSGYMVEVHIENLKSGTLYNFTVYTIFANLSSRGISHEAPTVPLQVSSVDVTRDLTTITLQWSREKSDWNYLVHFNGSTDQRNITDESPVRFTGLKPGTVYSYSIQTEFRALQSAAFKNETVTVIDCSIVNWQVTETSIQGLVEGAFTNATASNGSEHHISGSNKEVNFTGLYPGATYLVKLMYNNLDQCRGNHTTIPPRLDANCRFWDSGYSIYVEWNSPSGIWDSVEVNVSNNVHKVIKNTDLHYVEIANFQPARKYNVVVSTLSGPKRSYPHDFICHTDNRGVIAGAFFGVFIFVVLVCVVAFIMLRRPDIIRNPKKSLNGEAKNLVKTKYIPLEKFPGQFSELSADENKGFSLDYEELASVGTEQTQNAATMPENKPKNRFINVLPYDRSRVKLTSSSPQNDYINASYMPGYNSDREFIAAQGPLPHTVNDFWRMIWEQKVTGIIMVTNCTEGGRIKCEQYWPDSNPRQCGDLEVFTTSEKKQSDWTLREFKVKQRRTSEERTVRHFHFTAWPDHGVPQGTQVLIEFRELVRRHMPTEAAGTPTVVHCSAGVGRTGTIIALDMLLQQMEKEKAVDIYGFVYKMRLNRPHMVQTESQYVFLHQCILDTLLQNEKHDENIYENELIYANATALREFQNNMNKA